MTFPTQSRSVLYSFCINFLHSLIIWWKVTKIYYYHYYFAPYEYFRLGLVGVFYLSLSNWKSPRVTRNFLSILFDLNTLVRTVSILPLISNSSIFFQLFEVSSNYTIESWYYCHLHRSKGFLFVIWYGPNICLLFRFLLFSLFGQRLR